MENNFKSLGLSEETLRSIEALGITEPSEIQREIIPLILSGNDVIGQAQTGTGKTLAFASSVLSKIDVNKTYIQSLILTPTRELALQVCNEFKKLNKSKEFNMVAVYGGDPINRQIHELKNGADVVVGTPGRVMDLIERKKLKLNKLSIFVLDEADEMLNMGFEEDIKSIIGSITNEKQTLMFSATMPKAIKKLAENYMSEDYKHIEIKSETKTSDNIDQCYTLVSEKHRFDILCRILDFKNHSKTIIFCHTKKECDELAEKLESNKYKPLLMHGDIGQKMRIHTLEKFKKGTHPILIATDIAARGIHIDNIDLVINYKVPKDVEIYVHRIGRTGRANNKGTSITFITNKDTRKLRDIEKHTKAKVNEFKVPTPKDILDNKYQIVLEKAKSVTAPDEAYEYLRDLNKTDLLNTAAALLKYNVDKSLKSDVTKNLTIEKSERAPRNIDKNKTRVFLTIGKKDRLKSGSLLDFIKEETKMKKDFFTNIEVLEKFTFVDVDSKEVNEFMKRIKGKSFNGRAVRAEISNKSKKR